VLKRASCDDTYRRHLVPDYRQFATWSGGLPASSSGRSSLEEESLPSTFIDPPPIQVTHMLIMTDGISAVNLKTHIIELFQVSTE
jgi:hypothetical protein